MFPFWAHSSASGPMVRTPTHSASSAHPGAVAPVLDSAALASAHQTSPNMFWSDIFLKLIVSLNFNDSTQLNYVFPQ